MTSFNLLRQAEGLPHQSMHATCRGGAGSSACALSMALLFLLAGRVLAAGATAEIKVDQVGYPATAPKVAFVASKNATGEFTVRRAGDSGVAFRAALAPAVDDADSGDRVQAA